MKRTILVAAALAAALLDARCSQLATAALNIANPTYSIRNLQPHVAIGLPLSNSAIDLDFDLGVDNPNSVGLKMSGINFDMLVNGNHLLSSQSSNIVDIPAKGYGAVHLRSRVGYTEIKSIWSQIVDLIQGNRANYEVRGTAYYDTPAGRLNFPVSVYANR
jgi:LEA14-like dessication related protein